jgi:hypothetical protein
VRLTTGQAAEALGLSVNPVKKLVATGLIPGALTHRGQVFPLDALQILQQAPHPDLSALAGTEVAVLRADAAQETNEPDREWIGVGAALSADQLLAALSGWWRCAPERVAAGKILPVTVAEFVVAVLTGLDEWQDNGQPATARRYRFTNARLAGYLTDLTDSASNVVPAGGDKAEQQLVHGLLGSRLPSQSGGPIAYVPAGPTTGPSARRSPAPRKQSPQRRRPWTS